MLVRDVMTRAVHAFRQDQLIDPVAAQMQAHGLAAAPVVDQRGAVVGVVSAAELLRQWLPREGLPQPWTECDEPATRQPRFVGELMDDGVPTACGTDDIADVARLMLERDLRCVPVVEGGTLCGTVSRRDILRTAIRSDDTVRLEVQHRLDSYTGYDRCWQVTVAHGTAVVSGTPSDDTEARIVRIMAESVPGVRHARVVTTGLRRARERVAEAVTAAGSGGR